MGRCSRKTQQRVINDPSQAWGKSRAGRKTSQGTVKCRTSLEAAPGREAPAREDKCGNVHSILPFQGNEMHHQGWPGWGGQWEPLFLPQLRLYAALAHWVQALNQLFHSPMTWRFHVTSWHLLVRWDHSNTNTAVLFQERNEVTLGNLQQPPQAQEPKEVCLPYTVTTKPSQRMCCSWPRNITRSPSEIFYTGDH